MATTDQRRADFLRLHESGFFILPNAWDVGSAVRLAKLGFKAIASTSSGAAWAMGKEDGELSRDEVLAHLRMLVDATDVEHAATLASHARLGDWLALDFRLRHRRRFRLLIGPDNVPAETRRRLAVLLARAEIGRPG